MRLLQFLFTLDGRVTQRQYLAAGALLTALKFSGEAVWVWFSTGVALSPLNYFHPMLEVRYGEAFRTDWPLLLAWSLPFLWVGFALTVRRIADSDQPPHLSLFFFIPGLNLLLFLLLCCVSTTEATAGTLHEAGIESRHGIREAAAATLTAFLLALPFAAFEGLAEYGFAAFMGAPFVSGLVSGYLWNRRERRSIRSTIGVSATAIGLIGGTLIVFAVEGLVCLAMAAPFGFVLSAMGAVAGRSIAGSSMVPSRAMGVLALPLPLLLTIDATSRSATFQDVESVIEVDALPARVFPLVARFPAITAEPEPLFRVGIARPMAATLEGEGVGAIRRCHFTTGSFVEPITVWDPPRRLAFSVTQQPRAMSEWTPYESILAPHLDGGTLRVSEGEFRLAELPGGRTRIVGRTRFALNMKPTWYWNAWGDAIIHRIHLRVLAHIKALAEAQEGR